MKYRPPLRTAEINAYNYGARARLAGIDLAGLAPLDSFPPMLSLTPAELEAVAWLGPDRFGHWAVRGWVEHKRD